MRIWIDLANSPHVPFFSPIINGLREAGHEVLITARDFAQTLDLAERAGFEFEAIGGHGGGGLAGKFENLVGRGLALRKYAQKKGFGLAVSHNSYSQIIAAKLLGIRSATLMDYEHQPANHLAFRLASRIIIPDCFPEASLRKFGASLRRASRYPGIKEDVYLADFKPDESFIKTLSGLGTTPEDILVALRPPADFALYHRFKNPLFDALLEKLKYREGIKAIFLARTPKQYESLKKAGYSNFIFPDSALDGANLIHYSDLVVSAGGTMNREAAALGTPCATIYAGEWAAVDEMLVKEGRMLRISRPEDIEKIEFRKKRPSLPRANSQLKKEIIDLILS